jgi:hypothetical protein
MSIRNPSCVSSDVRRLAGIVAASYGPGFGTFVCGIAALDAAVEISSAGGGGDAESFAVGGGGGADDDVLSASVGEVSDGGGGSGGGASQDTVWICEERGRSVRRLSKLRL